MYLILTKNQNNVFTPVYTRYYSILFTANVIYKCP